VNPESIKSTKGKALTSDQRTRFDNLVQTRLLAMEGESLHSENQLNAGNRTGL